jgi:hypothetical protein
MTLIDLWLPIVLSAIVVFVASFIAWMVLPHHKSDWAKLPDEDRFTASLRDMNIPPRQYIFPCSESPEEMKSDAFKQRLERGPRGTLNVWAAPCNMGTNLLLTFLFFLFISFVIGYLGTIVLERGEGFMKVFRVTGTAGILAYCCGGILNAIWFKKTVLNDMLDGLAYALLTGLVFAMLWPAAS